MKKFFIILPFSLILFLGFAPILNPTNGNWYQQFMPSIGGRGIRDIFFLDSLTGWAVTNATNQQNDTTFVLKTTNGGDNWSIQYRNLQNGGGFPGYFRIYFLNQQTGYTCSVQGFSKTTNGGTSWTFINTTDVFMDMSILNVDTQWIASSEPLLGGVFYTSNGGISWQQQSAPPSDHIYMYNSRIGFIASTYPNIYKTTNGGQSWNINTSGEFFTDIHFVDSLTGWRCMPSFDTATWVKKTTDGGLNWIKQILPHGGIILTSQIYKFAFINKDTIWGSGGQAFYGGGFRGILYRTNNGGNNWLFQVPDTSFGIAGYGPIQFINKNIGWANANITGIHTTTGGDTTFLTNIKQVNNNIPVRFILEQNYPNPFNPRTIIRYELKVQKFVKLTVFDITGKHIIDLVNQKQNAGIYEVDFSGINYSSGVYFYSLFVGGNLIDTKKMILIK